MYEEEDGSKKGVMSEEFRRCSQGLFYFGSWFDSKSSAEDGIHVGAEIIGVVKTTINIVKEYTTNKLTRYWPGGSYLILKNKFVVNKNSLPIDIGYKHKFWNVLSLIVTERSGSKIMVLPIYLSNLIISIILSYDLLFIPISCLISCLSYLDMSKQLSPTTKPDSHIQPQKCIGLLSVVDCSYVL